MVHNDLPYMWNTVWALITPPPDLTIAVWLDVDVAMVHVALYMPLLLQLFSKQAGVGPNLFRLSLVHLLHAVIAVANVRGFRCRSTCCQTQSSTYDELLKHFLPLARK